MPDKNIFEGKNYCYNLKKDRNYVFSNSRKNR